MGCKTFGIVLVMLMAGLASALPTTGAATDVTSNSFNVSVTGITGTDAWITWGDGAGLENWVSPNETATAGSASIMVIGAPLYGGEHIYYQACDNTGCGNEVSTTLSAVTPAPTTTYGQFLRNITKSRFNPAVIQQSLLSGYTSVTPQSVVFAISIMFFLIGMWTRTKSVRLILIVGLLISPFVLYSWAGLYLGLPALGISLGQGLLAIAMAGVLFSFMRN